jgi:hypothetical protein
MLREIIIPQNESYHINIPKEYINQKVEILVFPLTTPNENVQIKTEQDILTQTAGLLSSKEIDPLQWQKSVRDEYER